MVVAESLQVAIQTWPEPITTPMIKQIQAALAQFADDASADVRKIARYIQTATGMKTVRTPLAPIRSGSKSRQLTPQQIPQGRKSLVPSPAENRRGKSPAPRPTQSMCKLPNTVRFVDAVDIPRVPSGELPKSIMKRPQKEENDLGKEETVKVIPPKTYSEARQLLAYLKKVASSGDWQQFVG
jgi:hypothetical protein